MTKGKGQAQAYGDESYWDNRYSQDAGSFDWYQRYDGLAPLINIYFPKPDKMLMVGCGNAVSRICAHCRELMSGGNLPCTMEMRVRYFVFNSHKVLKAGCFVGAAISEDMVNDGYQDIINIDISQVVIDAMVAKYKDMPQLQYQRMDVRDMKAFKDGQFDSVLDKGMFDSLMCGASAPYNASAMISEVRRVLRPGGVYMLITYGDPRVRVPHLKTENFLWDIKLHVIPRPGSRRAHEGSSRQLTDPVFLGEDLTLGSLFNLEDPDLHYVYVCTKEAGGKAPDKGKKDEKRPSKKK